MKAKFFINGLAGFCYDFFRFLKYTSAIGVKNKKQLGYRIVKLYHGLEKSLSFRDRSPDSGWRTAGNLIRSFQDGYIGNNNIDFQEKVALKVLSDFAEKNKNQSEKIEEITRFLSAWGVHADEQGGAIELKKEDLLQGVLDSPERFFFSRKSVRDFSSEHVETEIVMRAIYLATSSPSVCNRQAWHVYHLDQRESIDRALSFQNGNRGFGHEIPCLLIVAADLSAFDSGAERYQHWIDGGMFAMSLVLACHSLGLATCCLNWSKGPRHDIAFRQAFPVLGSHAMVMQIAVGYASKSLKVCSSPRRPVEEIYTRLA
ncbi:nitroreductase family protein [Lamprobacter modestohalophilus]|uniref:nitroreductase family protein n=1 Tax=Lamprobacter modestohalophilus TaxID=1064514 RepID=UPI002ADEA8DC|nr:nitroreductase family protein [Lamprobacter modestohalophilus]MEA1049006.1 nitroreductase family protein [Lamprobacter modestohalophilus]